MNSHKATILIAAPAGALRSALTALLESLPGIGNLILTEEPEAIEELVASAAPKVILLAGMEKKLKPESVANMREAGSKARIIWLIDDVHSAHPDSTAADVVLQQGIPAKELAAAVEQSLE
jgi:DNA-binding NarL/FixJ family response regulator